MLGKSIVKQNTNGWSYKLSTYVVRHDSTTHNVIDLIQFFATMYLTISIPLRTGFRLLEWKPWLAFDLLVDIGIVIDIVLNCLTTFDCDGEAIKDRSKIFARYRKGWFFLDVISVLPLELCCLSLWRYEPAFRCNRLLRACRITYYFSQWEKGTSMKPSVIRIIKSTFIILLLAHCIGCCFFVVVYIEQNAEKSFTGTTNLLHRSLSSKYLRSYYWAFATMTGYNNTEPHTQLETIFSIAISMIGISLFATIIGTVGSLVTNLDSSALHFRQKMDGIHDYMKYKRIPPDLQKEVRNYYTYLWKSGKGFDKGNVLDDLPPYLKNKMNIILNSEIIKKVPLFESWKEDTDFISEVVKCLKPKVVLPNTFVVRKDEIGTEMFFISRGELNVINDDDSVVYTFKDGGFFGEIALLYGSRRTASIIARTYCDMFVLTKDDFHKVMQKFPSLQSGIKEIARQRYETISSLQKEASSLGAC